MQIFKNNNGILAQIKETGFELEKHMQSLTERNLNNIFGLVFIESEFQINNRRIDTLAYDKESNSFVIIEYKRGNSYSVIDQGMSYLALMLNNKADFVQELAKKRNEYIGTNMIDWSQSRIIIIADSFNRDQKESINFKDLAIELRELKKFNDGSIIYNPIKASNTTESIRNITNFETSELKEIITYTEEYHFEGRSDTIKELYEELKIFILSLNDNIEIDYKKLYIAFKLNKKNLVDIHLGKGVLKIRINAKKGEIIDLYGITEDCSKKGHHGNGDYEIKINNNNEIAEIKDVIRQFYNIIS